MDFFTGDDDELLIIFGFILLLYCYEFTTNARRWWVRPIYAQRKEEGAFVKIFTHMKNYDHEMFFKYTRMYPEQFKKLLTMLRPRLLKRSRRESLCPELLLAMTLKYLAHGGGFQNLAWEFRVGHSTVSKVIRETCEAIWEVLRPQYLQTPEGNEWLDVSKEFWTRWNFPHTLDAIDGKHVQIQCPLNSGSEYYNYKNHFSIILLACCDADYKFLWIDLGAHGSENDASVFRRSQIGQELEDGKIKLPTGENLPGSATKIGYYFVGDEAFPLKPYIMRPYPGKFLDERKRIFNYRLLRARRIIENTFGILAIRWKIYRAPILCSVQTSKAMVKATICLHNFLRTEISGKYVPRSLVDFELSNGDIVKGKWRENTINDTNLTAISRVGSNVAPRIVCNMRDTLSNYLVTEAGAVPWQNNYVNRGRF